MPDIDHVNPEFVEAWDELKSRLSEKDFDLTGFLQGKKDIWSDETINELAVALKVEKYFRIDKEFNLWVEEENVIEEGRARFNHVFYRLGWVAAAVFFIFGFVIAPSVERHNQLYEAGIVPDITGFAFAFPDVKAFLLADALINAGDKYGYDLGISDPEGGKIRNYGQVKYADLENDGKTEIIYAAHGNVVCLNYDGSPRWVYALSASDFDESSVESIRNNLRFIKSNIEIFGPTSNFDYSKVDPEIPDLFSDPNIRSWILNAMALTDLKDIDNDGELEIIIKCVSTFSIFNVKGEIKNRFILLDGTLFSLLATGSDFSNDGGKEFVAYSNTNDPYKGLDGGILRKNHDDIYVYGTRPDSAWGIKKDWGNNRGLFITSPEGNELCHLNLPYHCEQVHIADWDNDGQDEILLDLYTPNNGYAVRYDSEFRSLVGNNFDWKSWDEKVGQNQLIDRTGTFDSNGMEKRLSVIMILGINNGLLSVEFFQQMETGSIHTYMTQRPLEYGEGSKLVSFQYSDFPDSDGLWCRILTYNPEKKEYVPAIEDTIRNGYPEMRFNTGIFGYDTPDGWRMVFGLSPLGQVMILDKDFNLVGGYTHYLEHNDFPRQYPWNCDAVVYDVGDLDGDGAPEILAGFGPAGSLHAPWELKQQEPGRDADPVSVLKVLTYDGGTFRPDHAGWDTIEVDGPILEAGIERAIIEGSETPYITVVSDKVYFFKLRE